MTRTLVAPLLALFPLTACVVVGDVETETEDFAETEPFSRVVVDIDGGDVEIAGDAVQVGATGTLVSSFGRRAPDIRHYVDDGVLHVEGDCDPLAMVCAIDLLLVVHEGVRVEVHSGAGNVQVHDTVADVVVETGAGDVELARLSGRVEADTGAGAIALQHCSGEAYLDTGTGAVSGVGLSSPVVQVESGAGEVDLQMTAAFQRVDVEVGTGDVRVEVPAGAYALDVDTGAGDVDLAGVTDDATAASVISAHTGAGDVLVVGR